MYAEALIADSPVTATRSRASASRLVEPAISASINDLRRILRALRLAERQTHTRTGLSAAQLFVLRSLQDGNEASLSELAERTMTDRSSVAAVVDRLLDAGLVVRGTARADRRRAAIVVTSSGRARLARSPQPPTALLISALQTLSSRRQATLATGLSALASAMGLDDQPAGMLFDDGRPPAKQSRARRTTSP